MNRYDFLRSFWFHYAGLYPDNPQSHQFRDGYGGSTPVYWVRGTAIGIRQTVGTYTLVTNVIGEDVGMRIVPFLRRLGREFEDMDIHVDGMWCKSEFYGWPQSLDHEKGKIRCIQTAVAGADQSA